MYRLKFLDLIADAYCYFTVTGNEVDYTIKRLTDKRGGERYRFIEKTEVYEYSQFGED